MFSKVRYEGFAEMGKNPASVEMDSKELILNRDTFPKLPKFTQKFIIEHEKGHLAHDTDSEELADAYALKSLYKSEHKSLKKSVKALVDILPEDNKRIEILYNKALNLDNGKEIEMVNLNKILAGKNGVRTRFNADGEDDEETKNEVITNKRTGKRSKRYVDFMGFAMTPAEVAILIVAVIYVFKIIK